MIESEYLNGEKNEQFLIVSALIYTGLEIKNKQANDLVQK